MLTEAGPHRDRGRGQRRRHVGAAGRGDGRARSSSRSRSSTSTSRSRPSPGHELPRDLPCFRDPDYLVYGKSEAGGVLFGGYEHDPVARWLDGVPWDHSGQSVPADEARFAPLMQGAAQALPVPRRRRRRQARLPPRRDDARRQPARRRAAGRARLLRRGRALAQRLRRRRRHRQGRGRARDLGRERARSAVLPPVALRRRAPRSASTPPRPRARPTATTTACATRSTATCSAGRRRTSALHERMQDAGAVFADQERLGARRLLPSPGRPWRRAGEEQRAFGWAEPPYSAVLAEESAALRERVGHDRHDVVRQDRRRGPGRGRAARARLRRARRPRARAASSTRSS